MFVRLCRCDLIDDRMAGGEALIHCDPGLTLGLQGIPKTPPKRQGRFSAWVSGWRLCPQGSVVQGGVLVAKYAAAIFLLKSYARPSRYPIHPVNPTHLLQPGIERLGTSLGILAASGSRALLHSIPERLDAPRQFMRQSFRRLYC